MIYQKQIILRSGETCTIRSCVPSDAEGVIENFNKTHGETDNLLTYPEEMVLNIAGEEAFLKSKAENAREAELCAVVNGRIVGTAGVEALGEREKIRHRAELGISVEKAFWGKGIGRALTVSCIECAREAGYAQLELQVVCDNEAAIALYKSVGFVEFGVNARGFRRRDESWQPVMHMRLELI